MCFAGIQGTGQAFRKFEDPNIMYCSKHHDIWEFKAPWKSKKEKQHAGLAFMAPRGLSRYMKRICVPHDPQIQGRGAVMYFSGLGYELIFVITYATPFDIRRPVQEETESYGTGCRDGLRNCQHVHKWCV